MAKTKKRSNRTLTLVDFSRPEAAGMAAAQKLPHVVLIDGRSRPRGLEVGMIREIPQGMVFPIPAAIKRRDFATHQTLVLDLENREDDEQTVAVSLLNSPGESWQGERAVFTAVVKPRTRACWRIPLQPLRYTQGWFSPWGWPRQPGMGALRFMGRMNTRNVKEVRIGLHPGPANGRVGLYRMWLEGPIRPEGWVDRYGQRTVMTWPGKVKNDADIVRADRREETELVRYRHPADRDAFHAWREAPARRATGFFRVEQVDGRWWFVAPNGRLYYATGMDCVICGVGARVDPTVRAAYSWLPPRKGPLAAGWEAGRRRGEAKDVLGLNMYRANLVRKWGPDFRRRFLRRAIARQLAWGFTSIGNWSDHGLFPAKRLPYFTTGPSHGDPKVPFVSKLVQDVFHPGFEANAMKGAERLSRFRNDPWCVGHFTFNEIGWTELPHGLLGPRDLPARRRFLALLKRRYRTIRDLNRAWGTHAQSFTSLRWPARSVPGSPEEPYNAGAVRDLAGFRGEFADRFFRIWNRACRAADPNHLVLGTRLHQGNRPPEVIRACARHMDLVSFNHYDVDPGEGEFGRYYAIAKKPFMIGEYGHNSVDTGLLSASVPVADQAARAAGYRYYTELLAAQPYFVGGHFFQYLDEPITGRFDRETSFNGFVNIADIPYPRMVRAARTSHARIYRVHAGLVAPYARRPRL